MMRNVGILSISAALTAVLNAPAHAEIKVSEMVRGVVEKVVQPGYAAASSTTRRLGDTMTKLCATPSQALLDEARLDFGAASDAWSEIEIVRIGPITENNRLERILYWPDRRSIGLKQVQAILAGKDATATETATLTQKSVAVQGFGALEFVLFSADAEELAKADGAFRCAYGSAITTTLHDNAEAVYKEWMKPDGIAGQWENPSASNPLYRTDDESLGEIIDTVLQGIEMVRDVRITGFLADKADDDKPKQAIYWRSNRTLSSISENLDGLRLIVEHSGLRDRLPEDQQWIADSIVFEFDNASKALFPLEDEPLADILADPEKRAKLDYARIVTSSLTELIGTRVTGALGITSGFSSLDGD